MRLIFDENFNHRVLRGLRIRVPALDAIAAQETDLKGIDDPGLLASAAELDRIVVTHDARTIPKFAYQRINAGSPMAGIIVVPDAMPIGEAIEQLQMVVECSDQREYINQVIHLPI